MAVPAGVDHGAQLTTAHASIHKAGGGDVLALSDLAIPTSAVQWNGQQLLTLVIENRTSDPVSAVVGQIWLRTDL